MFVSVRHELVEGRSSLLEEKTGLRQAQPERRRNMTFHLSRREATAEQTKYNYLLFSDTKRSEDRDNYLSTEGNVLKGFHR
ncbi:MAG: hypothetical protein JSR79_07410 [Proteobacteria bacterium]|nr:hypothetical protein [Pseudomonadota bacterium]